MPTVRYRAWPQPSAMSGFGHRALNLNKTEPVRPVYEIRGMAVTGCLASVIRESLESASLRVKGQTITLSAIANPLAEGLAPNRLATY
jgi:hypothetical protein